MDISTLANSSLQSGFAYVNGLGPKHPNRWRASKRTPKGPLQKWRGPVRTTPEQAAQDYCDYMNGNNVSHTPTLKSAGHAYRLEREDQDPEVAAAYGVIRDAKAQKAGKQGFIYLIREKTTKFGKIGYSVNPEKRIAEIQTGNPRQLELVGKVKGKPADELAMHAKYIKQNVLQEWFRVTDELEKEFA